MIWFLIVIGLLLVFLNFKAIKKDKNSFSGILHSTEEEMQDFEVKLLEIRREFAETLLDFQKEIESLKEFKQKYEIEGCNNLLEQSVVKVEGNDEIEEDNNVDPIILDVEKGKEILKDTESNNSIKIHEINELLVKGLSIEEISTKLKIGKWEVLLIKELYLK